jgi:hypothetical protein
MEWITGHQRDAILGCENPTMPQSTKERQEALRARRLMLGMTEVRGIFLPPELHAELKKEAARLRKRIDSAKSKPG